MKHTYGSKPHLLRLTALVLLLCLCVSLAGCAAPKSDEQKIQDRLNAFCFAVNSGDLEGALNCLNASSRNAYKSMAGIFGSLTSSLLGIDMAGLLVNMFGLSVGTMTDGEMLQMDVNSVSINGNKATVNVTMHYHDTQTKGSGTQDMTMVKENGDWYIMDDSTRNLFG